MSVMRIYRVENFLSTDAPFIIQNNTVHTLHAMHDIIIINISGKHVCMCVLLL